MNERRMKIFLRLHRHRMNPKNRKNMSFFLQKILHCMKSARKNLRKNYGCFRHSVCLERNTTLMNWKENCTVSAYC